jgi:hypothetical protein
MASWDIWANLFMAAALVRNVNQHIQKKKTIFTGVPLNPGIF